MATSVVELDFRHEPEGGDIDAGKALGALNRLRGQPHLIVLVHGYNDTKSEASQAYQAFCDNQQKLAGDGRDWAFGATLVTVYWPGDARWGILRPAYYPMALPVADHAAHCLCDVIRDLAAYSTGLRVDIVAHSLGNRLVLRALELLQGTPALTVQRVLHMAAAVATSRLEAAGDELHTGLLAELNGSGATSVHSAKDSVLAIWFRLGETVDLATEGVLPVALGHQAWLPGQLLAHFEQLAQDQLDHGDYWDKLDPEIIHRALESVVAIRRSTRSRDTLSRASALSDLPGPRRTPSRRPGANMN